MAKLSKQKIKDFKDVLNDFLNGKIYQPIQINGVGAYYSCLAKLEELRKKMVGFEEEKVRNSRSNQATIASIIHDLKTPIAVISGYAECIQDGLNDKDYAHLISEKIDQMNDLVLSLLDINKKKIEDTIEEFQIVDAKDYFEQTYLRLLSLFNIDENRLKFSKIPSIKIRISPLQIGRVLQNLVSNALKYSDNNSQIKINFKAGLNFLIFKVKDKGIGISKNDQTLIFDQFYKVDKSRTDLTSHGIGLYTTKKVIEETGGKISVKSKLNKGTTFIVELPICENENRKTFANQFNSMRKISKMLHMIFLGFPINCIYRASKYFEKRDRTILIGIIVSILYMPFVWIIDVISVAVYGKIVLLAEDASVFK